MVPTKYIRSWSFQILWTYRLLVLFSSNASNFLPALDKVIKLPAYIILAKVDYIINYIINNELNNGEFTNYNTKFSHLLDNFV